MSKVIVHIDLNAFFVRAEEIKDPTLEGKPVAIGHLGRCGIVSTCSYEARKYGISSGMPMYKAVELCPNIIIKPDDYRYYSSLSIEFIKFVKQYTNKIEVASIDECYADFTDVIKGIKDVKGFFLNLQLSLLKKTKLKCSIGVGPTRFLAKMGSDYRKPMGLTIIRKKDIANILFPLPIEDVFGIGKKSAPRIRKLGINTIGELYERIMNNDLALLNVMGKQFFNVMDCLNGKSSDEIYLGPWDPKSIGSSTTFHNDTNDIEEIRRMFLNLSKEVSERCKKENKIGNTIQIVVKEPNFVTHNKSLTFPNPTNEWSFIYNTAIKLYEKHFYDLEVRLVGVTLQNLINPKDISIQMSFFDYEKHEEESQTKLLINELNRKMKKPMLKRASEIERKK